MRARSPVLARELDHHLGGRVGLGRIGFGWNSDNWSDRFEFEPDRTGLDFVQSTRLSKQV